MRAPASASLRAPASASLRAPASASREPPSAPIAYQSTRALWRRLGRWRRFAIGLLGSYRFQDDPATVFGSTLATSLQVSGQLVYEAWLVVDPAPAADTTYDVHAELWAHARGWCSRRAAIGMGQRVAATAQAFDGATEVGSVRASARIRSPRDRDSQRDTEDYTITLPAGVSEHRLGRATTGPGFHRQRPIPLRRLGRGDVHDHRSGRRRPRGAAGGGRWWRERRWRRERRMKQHPRRR